MNVSRERENKGFDFLDQATPFRRDLTNDKNEINTYCSIAVGIERRLRGNSRSSSAIV